jgi:hypothetical protein
LVVCQGCNGLDGLLGGRDTCGSGCPPKSISTVNRVEPRGVKTGGRSVTPLGSKNSGHSCRVVVLARTPVVRGFKVQQRLDAHRGDGFESTGRLATGFLDEGHVGSVEAVTGG